MVELMHTKPKRYSIRTTAQEIQMSAFLLQNCSSFESMLKPVSKKLIFQNTASLTFRARV